MTRQALIINITRMGDLVQTGPLIARLHEEWRDAAVDLVVDRSFALMASLLPGVRQVFAFDFQGLIDQTRTMAKDVVALSRELSAWVSPLRTVRYDRVVNLTFNKRSALLAAYLDAPDIRGATATADGACVIRNPWLSYFTDLHHYRRFNRFNLVDLYALGGSGVGAHQPLTLTVTQDALDWADGFLHSKGMTAMRIAVQVGASDPMKAWRPEYVGRAMAEISRRIPAVFVLIGTKGEAPAVRQAVASYRAAGGTHPLCDAVDHTNLSQLAALLARCRLLLSNDTGPMHIAVAAGTPVLDLSVGHVDYNETGPYGAGHWAVQPDLECAPCGFDQVCAHQACKDRLIPEQVALLALCMLDVGPFPSDFRGVRVYESGIDADGLSCWNLRAGQEDRATQWYGTFWRRFWYETFTGQKSHIAPCDGPPPDAIQTAALFDRLASALETLSRQADQIVRLSGRSSLQTEALQKAQSQLNHTHQQAIGIAFPSCALGPVSVACMRDLKNIDAEGLLPMARQQAHAFRVWRERVMVVMQRLQSTSGGKAGAHALRSLAVLKLKTF
ncbi:MAG: glycosyltransferase family 9 protein [Nitrospiraceae bacterium]